MSDLDGERAFDLITDRMLDLQSRLDLMSRERNEAASRRLELERQLKIAEERLHYAAAAAARFKALVPPDVLKAHEEKMAANPLAPKGPAYDSGLPDDLPF